MSDMTETVATTNGVAAENLVPMRRRKASIAPPAGSVEELRAKREAAEKAVKEADAELDALIAAKEQELAALKALRGPVAIKAVPAVKAKPTPAPAKPKPATAKPKGERLARRDNAVIDGIVAELVEKLKVVDGGLRSEEIQEVLNLEAKALPRILKRGLSEGLLRSEGVRRSTRYFAATESNP